MFNWIESVVFWIVEKLAMFGMSDSDREKYRRYVDGEDNDLFLT